MAVTATVEKKQYYLNLNNGSSSTGAIKLKKLSLGSGISKNADDTKACAIMESINDILAKSVYEFTSVVTSQLIVN